MKNTCVEYVASLSGSAQFSIACSTVKRERACYLFSRDVRIERMVEKGLIVYGCTGPRTAKRAIIAGNLPHVSIYM